MKSVLTIDFEIDKINQQIHIKRESSAKETLE